MHETVMFLLAPILIFFTHRLTNKPVLIWLLTTSAYLKYAATLPCNLSLKACFADINVSQGSVATYARCSGIFNIHLTANLPRNLPVRAFLKSVKIWLNYGHESVAPLFLAHPVHAHVTSHSPMHTMHVWVMIYTCMDDGALFLHFRFE